MKILIFSAFLVLLSSCGYTLRGSSTAELPSQLQTIYLPAGNSDILSITRRALSRSGVTVINQNQTGVYQLSISQERVSERVVSVNSSARAGEYELTMAITVQLNSSGNAIIQSEVLSTQRTYLTDPNNAVAKAEEAELIKTEMRQILVNQLLRRLQNLTFS